MAFISILLAFLCAIFCYDVVSICFGVIRVYYESLDFARVVGEDQLAAFFVLVKKVFKEFDNFYEVKVV